MPSINLQISRKAAVTYAAIVETFLDPVTRKKTSRTIKSYGNIKHLETQHADVMAFLYQERDRLRGDPAAVHALRSEMKKRIFPALSSDEKAQSYKAAPRLLYGDATIRTVWENLNLPQWFKKVKYNAALAYDFDLAMFYMTACYLLRPTTRLQKRAFILEFLFDYTHQLSLENLYDALTRIGQDQRQGRLMAYLDQHTEQSIRRAVSHQIRGAKQTSLTICCDLASACTDLSSEDLYLLLKRLDSIDEDNRAMKTTWQGQSIFLRKEEHIRGYFVVCVLALIIEQLMLKRLAYAGEAMPFEHLRELLLAPTVSPIKAARNKELLYLKTGFMLQQADDLDSSVVVDLVEEAERVMCFFGIKPLMTLASITHMRQCLPVRLPFAGTR